MLSIKKESRTILWVFFMTQPRIEPLVSWAIGKHSNFSASQKKSVAEAHRILVETYDNHAL